MSLTTCLPATALAMECSLQPQYSKVCMNTCTSAHAVRQHEILRTMQFSGRMLAYVGLAAMPLYAIVHVFFLLLHCLPYIAVCDSGGPSSLVTWQVPLPRLHSLSYLCRTQFFVPSQPCPRLPGCTPATFFAVSCSVQYELHSVSQ